MSVGVHASVEGRVGTLLLDEPPRNLLTDPARAALRAALDDFQARGVRAVILTGRGPAFCAGATRAAGADEAVCAALAGYPGGVIAAVNGDAHGSGLELALACDIRIAARPATFASAAVALGLVASTARLTRLCGEAVAQDLLLTGRTVGADEALGLGLVSAVVEEDALLDEARRWSATVASRAPLSVQANKEALVHCARLPLAEAVAWERGEWARLQRTRDHKEALEAFFAKRTPDFTGA